MTPINFTSLFLENILTRTQNLLHRTFNFNTYMKSVSFLVSLSVGFLFSSAAFSNNKFQQEKDSILKVIPTLMGEEKLDAYEKVLFGFDNVEATDNSIKEYLQILDASMAEAQSQGNIKEVGRSMINSAVYLSYNKRWKELDERKNDYLNYTYQHELWNYYYALQANYIEDYYLKTGQTERAIRDANELYEKAKTAHNPTGILISQLGIARALNSQRRHEEAEIYFENALKAYEGEEMIPPYVMGWWSYCALFIETKQWEKAIEKTDQFDTISRQYLKEINQPYPFLEAVILRLYAHAYTWTGKLTEAEANLNKADSLSSDLIGLSNSYSIRAEIAAKKGEYRQALEHIAKVRKLRESKRDYINISLLQLEATVWAGIENAEQTLLYSEKAFQLADSISYKEFNEQLDDLRTKYEVDRHIAEKEKVRNLMYFAIAGCILLMIILAIWIYYNRKIAKKNKALANQIKELLTQHEKVEEELLNKENFEIIDSDDDFYPETRKDQLCLAVRDILLKEKAYRNPNLTRDYLIDYLGTSKELFVDAFRNCFGMSFSEYLNFLRLKDGITLLEKSDLSIEEISEKVGFGTVRTFQRQFQTKYNMSPKDYRKASMN